MRTYYDRPVLKEPVWKWPVPAYFFTGGVAAGSSLLAAGGRLTGDAVLERRCLVVSAGATAVSGALLVKDLGRPARFLNMLRVAKVTSPMSVGSWVLAGFGSAITVAAAAELASGRGRGRRGRGRRGRGRLRTIAGLAEGVAAGLAPVVGTYTAVLVADTAVPVWHEARRELPFLFAGSALASSGSVALLVGAGPPARRAAVLGATVELAAARRMERRLGDLGQPYREGRAGRLSELARAATAAGAVLTALSGRRGAGRRRVVGTAGPLLLAAGALAERFAVFSAGIASARDPRYTVGPQRERLGQASQTLA